MGGDGEAGEGFLLPRGSYNSKAPLEECMHRTSESDGRGGYRNILWLDGPPMGMICGFSRMNPSLHKGVHSLPGGRLLTILRVKVIQSILTFPRVNRRRNRDV